jgi:hypothetical protein
MDLWLSSLIYTLAAILIIFFTSLYASKRFRKLWFAWYYTIFCTSFVKHGGDAIREKLFKKLSTIEPKDPSKKLVNVLFNKYFQKYSYFLANNLSQKILNFFTKLFKS